ncbi:uncharacterized protein LOC113349632 [Papaver somniferum]|uniref:uncharacterized protein LOC113349632 n=1 Tax=Papaver somniferum TaxID=3469 RepID=UPI000E703570|nr:uncharacterized protein LOC113349632 [Papaver somniferum]
MDYIYEMDLGLGYQKVQFMYCIVCMLAQKGDSGVDWFITGFTSVTCFVVGGYSETKFLCKIKFFKSARLMTHDYHTREANSHGYVVSFDPAVGRNLDSQVVISDGKGTITKSNVDIEIVGMFTVAGQALKFLSLSYRFDIGYESALQFIYMIVFVPVKECDYGDGRLKISQTNSLWWHVVLTEMSDELYYRRLPQEHTLWAKLIQNDAKGDIMGVLWKCRLLDLQPDGDIMSYPLWFMGYKPLTSNIQLEFSERLMETQVLLNLVQILDVLSRFEFLRWKFKLIPTGWWSVRNVSWTDMIFVSVVSFDKKRTSKSILFCKPDVHNQITARLMRFLGWYLAAAGRLFCMVKHTSWISLYTLLHCGWYSCGDQQISLYICNSTRYLLCYNFMSGLSYLMGKGHICLVGALVWIVGIHVRLADGVISTVQVKGGVRRGKYLENYIFTLAGKGAALLIQDFTQELSVTKGVSLVPSHRFWLLYMVSQLKGDSGQYNSGFKSSQLHRQALKQFCVTGVTDSPLILEDKDVSKEKGMSCTHYMETVPLIVYVCVFSNIGI